MTFAFYLKDKHKKDGSPLVLIISQNNHKYKKQIGITVRPEDFKKQRTKDENVNTKLRIIENRLNEKLNQFSTEEDIRSALEYAITGKDPRPVSTTPSRLSFWEYFAIWKEKLSSSIQQRRLCYTNISKFMGQDFDWEDVDDAFFFRLTERMNDAGFSVNYKWRTVQQLRCVMNEGLKQKFHRNDGFKEWKNPKEDADTVYLTKDELEALVAVELKAPMQAKARDLFILGVYTAARFSDYSRLTSDMIQDGIIHITQKKTTERVLIPAAPRVLEVLERNGGHAPALSQQRLNDNIKLACKEAGIDTPVQVTHSEGDRHITETKPKYELVSSHTARRTGATLLYQSGIPAAQCMMLTGHRKESTFFKYIKTTKEENAEMLRKAAFFQ